MLDYSTLLEVLLPPGPLWRPAPDEGLEELIDGMAANEEVIWDFLKSIGYVRDPYRTPVLEDLEKEYGIFSNPVIAEALRRAYLAAVKYARIGRGQDTFLQDKLHEAGFTNAFVYQNDPRVDPAKFINGPYLMYAGEPLAQAGEPLAQAGGFQGELLVNGDLFTFKIDYLTMAGETLAQADEPVMMAGNFSGVTQTPFVYPVPTDSTYWPAIFFVGGPATYAPDTGAEMYAGEALAQAGEPLAQAGIFYGQLIDIEFIDIDSERREQFRRLILKIKPLHSWAALVVNYT